MLAGCNHGGGNDAADPATGDGVCKVTTASNVIGEPDINGAVTISPSTATKGAMVTFNIPIDADTRSVNAVLRTQLNGSIAGCANYPVATLAAQTASVSVKVSASAPADTYRVLINLYSGYNPATDCAVTGATGTLISYGELANTSTTFARWVSVKDGQTNNSGVSTETCLPIPKVTVQ